MEEIEEKVRLCGYALKDAPRFDHLKKMQFLKKAHDHFFELTRSFNSTHFSPYSQDWVYPSVLSSSTGWEYVRKVVLMAYGVSDICSLPDDKEEEVNAFAIELTDMLFSLAYIIQRIEGFLYHLVAQIMQEIPESNRTKPKTKFQPFHKTTS